MIIREKDIELVGISWHRSERGWEYYVPRPPHTPFNPTFTPIGIPIIVPMSLPQSIGEKDLIENNLESYLIQAMAEEVFEFDREKILLGFLGGFRYDLKTGINLPNKQGLREFSTLKLVPYSFLHLVE